MGLVLKLTISWGIKNFQSIAQMRVDQVNQITQFPTEYYEQFCFPWSMVFALVNLAESGLVASLTNTPSEKG